MVPYTLLPLVSIDLWMHRCQTYLKCLPQIYLLLIPLISSFPSLLARQSRVMFTQQAPWTLSLLLPSLPLYNCPLLPRGFIFCLCSLICQIPHLLALFKSLFFLSLEEMFATEMQGFLLKPGKVCDVSCQQEFVMISCQSVRPFKEMCV